MLGSKNYTGDGVSKKKERLSGKKTTTAKGTMKTLQQRTGYVNAAFGRALWFVGVPAFLQFGPLLGNGQIFTYLVSAKGRLFGARNTGRDAIQYPYKDGRVGTS